MSSVCFCIGNHLIERKIYFCDGVPVKSCVSNKQTGMLWQNDGSEPVICFDGMELGGSEVIIEQNRLYIIGRNFKIKWEFTVFDDLPIIQSRIGIKGERRGCQCNTSSDGQGIEGVVENPGFKDYIEGIGSTSNHVTLKAVQFFDRTDYTNYLVDKKEVPLYSKRGITGYNGHIFVLSENITGEECILIKNAPCGYAHYNKRNYDFIANSISNVHLASSGIDTAELDINNYSYTYSTAIGVCEKSQWVQTFRDYYCTAYQKKTPYIMSNTWGDRNQDKCICEEFLLKELQCAQRLGIDVVQVDDGWQEGITANSALVEGGCWGGNFRNTNPDFWSIHKSKFPNGFHKVLESAKEKNITIGLWFSPDNFNDYASWLQDADTIISLYKEYGISYFKLDGITIDNRLCEERILNMINRVNKASNGNVVFNMDITNGKRFGYLLHKQIGDLFVENRYTDATNYYPHNTLRNLWDLSEFIPSWRLQMEVLNHKRNQNLYSDILAPSYYDIDYLFASVMVANPLLWMEMSSLDEQSINRLSKIIDVYKQYRDDFCDVVPILERPSGFSLTGFKITGKKNNYVILIRELSDNDTFDISVKRILMTNDDDVCTAPVRLTRQRTYLFAIC